MPRPRGGSTSSMEWGRFVPLVDKVSVHPCLYMKKHESFRNLAVTDSLWREIAENLKAEHGDDELLQAFDAMTAKCVWGKIRKRFAYERQLEHKSKLSGSAGGTPGINTYRSKWVLFDVCSFLRDDEVQSSRKGEGNYMSPASRLKQFLLEEEDFEDEASEDEQHPASQPVASRVSQGDSPGTSGLNISVNGRHEQAKSNPNNCRRLEIIGQMPPSSAKKLKKEERERQKQEKQAAATAADEEVVIIDLIKKSTECLTAMTAKQTAPAVPAAGAHDVNFAFANWLYTELSELPPPAYLQVKRKIVNVVLEAKEAIDLGNLSRRRASIGGNVENGIHAISHVSQPSASLAPIPVVDLVPTNYHVQPLKQNTLQGKKNGQVKDMLRNAMAELDDDEHFQTLQPNGNGMAGNVTSIPPSQVPLPLQMGPASSLAGDGIIAQRQPTFAMAHHHAYQQRFVNGARGGEHLIYHQR